MPVPTYTDLFNEGYDDLVAKLQTVSGLQVVNDPRNIVPPCVFVNIDSIDGFAAAKNVAMRSNSSASVVAFIGSEESHVYEGVTHCYGLMELINFLFCVDSAKSALSIFRG